MEDKTSLARDKAGGSDSMAQRWARRAGRFAFLALTVAIWLVTVAVVLEAATVAVRRIGIATNPFIQNYLVQRTWFSSEEPAEMPDVVCDRPPNGPPLWPDAAGATPKDNETVWDPFSPDESAEEIQRQRLTFASLDEGEKGPYALLRQECVLCFSASGVLDETWGDWRVCRGMALGSPLESAAPRHGGIQGMLMEIRSALDDVLRGRRPVTVKINPMFVPSSFRAVEEVFIAPDEHTGGADAFFHVRKDLPRPDVPLPPESPWDIPFFRYKPNVKDGHSGLGQGMQTNSYGFRDEEVAVPKPEGVFRIVCFGGSTTEEGMGIAGSYPNRLERRLQEQFPGKQIEVINCGVCGMDTDKHMAQLNTYLMLEPDLCVVYEGINDCVSVLPNDVLPRTMSGVQRTLCRSWFLRRFCSRWLRPDHGEYQEGFDRITFTNMAAIHHALKRRGIPLVLCSMAYPAPEVLSREEYAFFDFQAALDYQDPCHSLAVYIQLAEEYNARLRAFCERNGLLYVPVAENLRGGTAYFVDICHMTDAGIAAKAHIIFECIKDVLAPRLS